MVEERSHEGMRDVNLTYLGRRRTRHCKKTDKTCIDRKNGNN